MKKYILVTIFLLILPISFAMQGSMPLLAVKESSSGLEGSTAELFLEIVPGTGRVFVDTFPLSKIDTQISMRFAKEIACDFIDENCDRYDFIYTIKADSPIIGGPSAGAAATILTVAVLKDKDLIKDTAMTGTINSGGLVGPVGGLKEKIEAGAKSGLKTILIPEGEKEQINDTNSTIDLIEFGNNLNMKVIEVGDMNEALEIFTGEKFQSYEEDIMITKSYKETMQKLASQLCERNKELKQTIVPEHDSNTTRALYNDALNLSLKGDLAFNTKQFYASASYCFGSNVKLNQVFLENKNFSLDKYKGLMDELMMQINKFEEDIDNKEIKTMTDLESYMVVKERLTEAREFVNFSEQNQSLAYAYSYANERLRSAYSWAEFFGNPGKELNLDEESLKDTCRLRIAETEERLQYISLYLPFPLRSARDELSLAYTDFNNKEYALCLFKASKAKAEANIVLNTLGVGNEFIPKIIENKLNAAGRVILKGERKGIFPVLGYSYYEYANNLKENDKFSALLYAEYALELSNLDIYFKERENNIIPEIDLLKVQLVAIGVIIGIVLGIILMIPFVKKNKVKKVKGNKRKK